MNNNQNTRVGFSLLCVLAVLALAGCADTVVTNPARSATEQLLLSTSADRAVASIDFSAFAGKKVFLDATYFDSYDSKNAIGTIRDAVSSAGAFLTPTASAADILIEARSGALSIDYSQYLIGLPSSGVPIPLAGTFNIPEVALFKDQKQKSTAKFALLAYQRANGEHFFSSGPMVGKSYNNYYKLLGFITWTGTDIPEKKKHHPAKSNH